MNDYQILMRNMANIFGRLQRAWLYLRAAAGESGFRGVQGAAVTLFFRTSIGRRLRARLGERAAQEANWRIALPKGYASETVEIKIREVLPRFSEVLEFSDHALNADGCSSSTVLATIKGGLAVSTDLGRSWKPIRVTNYVDARFLHAKGLGDGEYLATALLGESKPSAPRGFDLLVTNADGDVLAANTIDGFPWHGCRAVDFACGTLMFAEYTANVSLPRDVSRVFRSRDRGRSWEVVFTCDGSRVRHFHFLQARPGHAGEWWLTSGDSAMESDIWVSKDDGDSWDCLTETYAERSVTLGMQVFPRALFRLTDLAWDGDEIVWGTDDYLPSVRNGERGSHVFRSPIADVLVPSVVGHAGWQIRNMVDIGAYYLLLTQGSNKPDATPAQKRPSVFLMPKKPVSGTPPLLHLFDVESHSSVRTAFTYSRASRAAKDGTFFTYRGPTDVFPYGQKILRWDVRFR